MDPKELLAKIKAALAKKEGGDAEALGLIEAAEEGPQAKLTELLGEVKKLKGQLKAFDGVDPEEHKTLKDRVQELEAAAAKGTTDSKAAVERIEAKYRKEVEKLTTELTAERGVVSKLLVENGLTEALAKVGVTEAGMKFARAYFVSQGVEIEVDGEDRTALIGEKPLAAAVADWAKTDEAKMFLRAPASAGGGAGGGAGGAGGGKTMIRGEFDKLAPTDQMKFVKDGGKVVDAA